MTTLSALTVGASAAPNEWTTPGTSPMEVIASANDTSYGEIANNAAATFDQGYELNAVPADLGNVDDLSVRIRYFWAATPNGLTTWDTLAVRIMSGVTVLAAADAGGTFKTLASSITTTTATNTTLSAFAYVNTGAAKSLWDAAVVQIRQTSSKTKGGDTTGRRVSAFEVSGNYTIGGTDANVTATVVTGTGSVGAPTVATPGDEITFVAATEMATTSASTSHALTLPSYQADDIIVVSAAWTGTPSSVTDDLGFTDVFADQWGTNSNPRSSLMWKRMTGSEGATITLTTGNSITAGVSAQCFRGVDTTTALDAAAANYSGLSGDDLFDVPSVTPVTAGAMHVVGAANNSSSQTFDPPTGYTEDADTNLLGAGRGHTAAHLLLGAAAATGVITFARAGGGTTFDYNTWSLVLRPTAGGAANVTATTVTSTSSIPTQTVAAGAALTATVITSTGSVGAPTVSTGTDANVTTTVVTSTGSVGAVTVAAGAALTATIVTSTSSVPAPTVSAGGAANVTTTVVTSTGSVGAPTVAAGAVVAATTVTSTSSVGAPTVAAGAVVAATVVTSTGSVGAPSVSTGGDATVTATVVTSTGSVGAPTVTAGGAANVTATVVTSTSSVGAPTVAAGAAITATVVTSTSSVGVVTVTGDANVSVATVTSTSSVQTVSVAAGVSLTATVVTSTSSVQTVSVSAGASVSPTAISSTGSVGAPTVTIGELLGVLLYGMIVAWSEPRTVVGSEPAADAWSEPGVVGHGNPTPTGEAFDAAYDEAFG